MCFSALTIKAQDSISLSSIQTIPDHPRLLLLTGEENGIREKINDDIIWSQIHQTILSECDDILHQPPVERIQIGRRLLDKSRTCLRRTFFLSYAYRITKDQSYAKRAKQELIQVSGFTDWNPSHFLDVAEMSLAVALGYDWLYDYLSPTEKLLIRTALIEKGIKPSLDSQYNWFLTSDHNWNQVCNAGMTFAALAIAEDQPELANQIINRGIKTIRLPMTAYGPDGAYPEGYAYWDYGTSFNILFINALEKAFSSDFNLTNIPGFLSTAQFMEHMTGPGGMCFNWGDSHLSSGISPGMFWLAHQLDDPSLLWVEKSYLEQHLYQKMNKSRLLPALMLWGMWVDLDQIKPPSATCWYGQGTNPVAMLRTSWSDPNAIYLGFKAGSPSVNHAHMDVGSFVMEANGVRWASELGMQNYESLESKGIQLWGRTQDAQRWTIKRLNNFVHNTWTFSGELQQVDGYAKIDHFSDDPMFSSTVSDLTSLYDQQVASAKRGVAIKDQSYVIIRDEIEALGQPVLMRWTMLTTCEVHLSEEGLELEKEGKKLTLMVTGPKAITWKTWSTVPTTDFDAPNPGTVLVGFEYQAMPYEQCNFEVLMRPDKVSASYLNEPLEGWITKSDAKK